MYLDTILETKQKEIESLQKRKGRFAASLKKPHLAVIAEVKRRSPSAGEIKEIEDPLALAKCYVEEGASAISVLTDRHFGGDLADLKLVARGISAPILRKDFILHPLQLAEAIEAGATAVLLIAGLLKDQLKTFLMLASQLGLETLTEVHNQAELELALDAGAPIIGVNHRNLTNFEIDLSLSEKLRPHIPPHVIAVAESGIRTPEQAKRMRELGYDAILVGEALVRSPELLRLLL